MNYQEILEYLYKNLPAYHQIGKSAYKADLENAYKLDDYFYSPHKKFKTIHVAGTNGKGSVSNMLAAVLQQAGYKTGLYTSPHLKDFRERFRVNGEMISEDFICHFVELHKHFFEKIKPSFFEMTVFMAFKFFEESNVDIAIIEVGLGGRLDTTNIIFPEVSVITNISFDHTDLLGNSLEKIAFEKAGIIKHGVPIIIGQLQNEVKNVFIEKAREMEAPLYFADSYYSIINHQINSRNGQIFDIFPDYSDLETDLNGKYQGKNILTVLQIIDILREKNFFIETEDVYEGLANVSKLTGLIGRWQIIQHNPLVIFDVAHNEDGIANSLEQLSNYKYLKLRIVFGLVQDKNTERILNLLPRNAEYYFTKANSIRALDEKKLENYAKDKGFIGNSFSKASDAYQKALKDSNDQDVILVFGSTFVVAEII